MSRKEKKEIQHVIRGRIESVNGCIQQTFVKNGGKENLTSRENREYQDIYIDNKVIKLTF